jgi:hypothetical protein
MTGAATRRPFSACAATVLRPAALNFSIRSGTLGDAAMPAFCYGQFRGPRAAFVITLACGLEGQWMLAQTPVAYGEDRDDENSRRVLTIPSGRCRDCDDGRFRRQFFMGYRYGIFNYATKALGGAVTVERFELSTP